MVFLHQLFEKYLLPLFIVVWIYVIISTKWAFIEKFGKALGEAPVNWYYFGAFFAIWIALSYLRRKAYNLSAVFLGSLFLCWAIVTDSLYDLTVFMAVAVSAICLGAFLLDYLFNGVVEADYKEFIPYAFGLGFGVQAIVLFFLGIMGLFAPGYIYTLVLLPMVVGYQSGFRALKRCLLMLDIFYMESKFHFLLKSIVCLLICLSTFYLVLPETWFDAVWFHLSVPKIYISQGQLAGIDLKWNRFVPHNVELNYVVFLLFNSEIATRLFNLFCFLCLGLLMTRFTEKHVSRSLAVLPAILFWSTPIVQWEHTTAYIDVVQAFYAFLYVYMVLKFLDVPSKKGAWLVGLTGGILLGVKNSSLQVVIAIAIVSFAYILLQKSYPKRRFLSKYMLAALGHVLFSGYWFIRAYLATGNPVFPFYNNIFKSPLWPAVNENFNLGDFGMGNKILDYMQLPWNLTFYPEKFVETGNLGIGVLFLLPLAVLYFFYRKLYLKRNHIIIACFSGILLVLQLHVTQYLRYLILALPFVIIILTIPLYKLYTVKSCRLILSASIVVILFVNGALAVGQQNWFDHLLNDKLYIPEDLITSSEMRKAAPARGKTPAVHAYQYLNDTFGKRFKILTLRDSAEFWANGIVSPYVLSNPEARELERINNSEEIFQYLLQHQYTHILRAQKNYLDKALQDLESKGLINRVGDFGGATLYNLVTETSMNKVVAVNLLQNGDFAKIDPEGQPDNWLRNGTPKVVADVIEDHLSSNVAVVDNNNFYFSALGKISPGYYKLANTAAGKSENTQLKLQVNWVGHDDKLISVNIYVVPCSSQYVNNDMIVKAPPGAEKAIIYVVTYAGQAYVGNISFIKLD